VWAVDADQEKQARTVVGPNAKRLTAPVRAAAESDDLRNLKSDAALMLLPLTRAQRVRANGLAGAGTALEGTALTPRQARLASQITATLRERAKGFEGLQYPADARDLGAYEDDLRARLDPQR
jgi:hypothetical protein